MSGSPQFGFEEIADRFAALWLALLNKGDVPRPDCERHILVDRVRDALDRGESRLGSVDVEFLANTFRLEEKVYEGASAQIFRARHRDLGSLHAIKILRQEQSADPIARQLILQEAEISGWLRHPRIVATQALLRLGDGRPAIVFEWCERNLASRLACGALSSDDIFTIITSVLEGLSIIHEHGIVHGDISPANILYDGASFASLKIADFGIAWRLGQSLKTDLRFAGTPGFAAPELVCGGRVDQRADLYAAGILLSSLLQQGSEPDTSGLHLLAQRLMKQQPGERPANAKAALHMLSGL